MIRTPWQDWRDRQKSLEAKTQQIYVTQNGFTQGQRDEHIKELTEIQDAQKQEVTKLTDKLFNSETTAQEREELICKIRSHEGFDLWTDEQQLLFKRKVNEKFGFALDS